MGLWRMAIVAIVWTMCLKGQAQYTSSKCLHRGLTWLAMTRCKSLEERHHMCML